ncbi:MAG: VacJ family lipoprotein [Lentisphaeria bacterium]|nr:VacJ family lipoprotein [Lentisphaeria bacterium]
MMHRRRFAFSRALFLAVLAGLVAVFSGCRSVPDLRDGEGEKRGLDWNASTVSTELAGNDPIEPFNRTMFTCTDVCMHFIVQPVGYVYGSILPMEVIKRINYASDNLAFPARMFSCFLQGQWKGGGVEFLRFLTNSTIGIAGFFDPADAWFDLVRQEEDFGQAFGYWNIGPGCYFILPFLTSTNVRDTVGCVFDRAADLKSYIPYIGYLTTLNSFVSSYDPYDTMTENAYDAYDTMKVILSLVRYAQVENFHHRLLLPQESDFGKAQLPPELYEADIVHVAAPYGAQNPLVDTLKGSFFKVKRRNAGWWIKTSLWNTDFVPKAKTRRIHFADGTDGADRMRFQIWCQEDPAAPLVLLLPGAGGHFRAEMLRALAEIYYEEGCTVAVLASTLNPEFFLPASLGLPGDVARDVPAVRKALGKVIEKVKEEFKLTPSAVIGCGYSLGGLHMLHLASLEEKEGNPLNITRFVSINPPADLHYALRKMDALCEIPRNMTKEEFFQMAGDAAMKLYLASSERSGALGILHPVGKRDVSAGEKPSGKEKNASAKKQENGEAEGILWEDRKYLPLTPEQAGWVSGTYMRMGLRELLLAAQRNSPEGKELLKTPYSWWSRTDLYREIDTYNWSSYAEKLLLPCLKQQEKNLDMASLGKRASLRKIEKTLRNNPRVRVLHNQDDPLLTPQDALFLDRSLGRKLVWFDCGGHLGNLFLPEYREKLLDASFKGIGLKKVNVGTAEKPEERWKVSAENGENGSWK